MAHKQIKIGSLLQLGGIPLTKERGHLQREIWPRQKGPESKRPCHLYHEFFATLYTSELLNYLLILQCLQNDVFSPSVSQSATAFLWGDSLIAPAAK